MSLKNKIRLMTVSTAIILAASVVAAGDLDESRTKIASMFPGVTEDNIQPSPIAGIFEVRVGSNVAYVSADGRYLIQGSIFDLASEQNLTEARRSMARVEAIDDLGEELMIIFSSEPYQHTVSVFTDVECGYCRKLHRQINEYNKLGIRIRYLFFPRGGPGSTGWEKAEKVWCAPDRKVALTNAKKDVPLEAIDCGTTPVAREYELGREFEIRGTPAIVTESGDLIGGYLPPDELLEYIVKANEAAKAE